MKVYAIYDMAAGAYLQPFYQMNDVLAIRLFAGTVNDEKSIFNQAPQDFTLHGLGEFDEQSGLFTQDKGPVPIRSASALIIRDVDPNQGELPLVENVQKGDGSYRDLIKERSNG